jgi:VWFA-related protein
MKKTAGILVLLFAAIATIAGQERTRRIYVTAVGDNGAIVTDLTADDFSVKESGKTRPILNVQPATAKMQIAIIVDDNGTGMFRVAIARFIESLLGRAEFSLSTVAGQTMKLVDYTTDTRELSAAIKNLGARPGSNDGNQLLDGITNTSLDMAKRKAGRPIIVALTVGGDDVTPMQPDDALDDLRKSGAQLYVVSVLNSALRASAPTTRASDLLEQGHALKAVLGDGPKRSGGDHQEISAMAGVDPRLHQIADQLKRQYVIEYSLEGAKPAKTVNVSVRRKDVNLRAPTHVPDRF